MIAYVWQLLLALVVLWLGTASIYILVNYILSRVRRKVLVAILLALSYAVILGGLLMLGGAMMTAQLPLETALCKKYGLACWCRTQNAIDAVENCTKLEWDAYIGISGLWYSHIYYKCGNKTFGYLPNHWYILHLKCKYDVETDTVDCFPAP